MLRHMKDTQVEMSRKLTFIGKVKVSRIVSERELVSRDPLEVTGSLLGEKV